MRRLIIAFTMFCAFPAIAFGQSRVQHQSVILSGCNAEPLDAGPLTCGGATGVSISGWNAITMVFKYAKGAGDGFDCTPWVFDETLNDWATIASYTVVTGDVTLLPTRIVREPGASDVITFSLTQNYERLKMVCNGRNAPDANDKLTVVIRNGYTPDI